jgi:hypothetical protein
VGAVIGHRVAADNLEDVYLGGRGQHMFRKF